MKQTLESGVELESHGPEPMRSRLALAMMLLLSVVGFGVAFELTHVFVLSHTDPDYQSFCAVSEGMNCETVALSKFATFMGVPNSVWAQAGYVFALLLGLLAMVRARSGAGIGLLFLLGSAFNVVSIWLLVVMHFVIGSLCVLCLALDVVNLGFLALAVVAARASSGGVLAAVVSDMRLLVRQPILTVVMLLAGVVLLTGAWFVGTRSIPARTLTGSAVAAFPKAPTAAHTRTSADSQCGDVEPPSAQVQHGVTPDGHHWIGSATPEVEIHEFTDYQCPHCRRAHMMGRKMLSENPERVRLYHRHLPLDQACNPAITRPFHQRACELSRVAACAGQQGRFWEMNDFLFQRSGEINKEQWSADDIASRLELDLDRFRCCMGDPKATEIVDQDIADGNRLGIKGTPAFVINGEIHYGRPPLEVLGQAPAQ